MHHSLSYFRSPPPRQADPHLELLTISLDFIKITNFYIPPVSSCSPGYNPHLGFLEETDSLYLGDANEIWSVGTQDARGNLLFDTIQNLPLGVLNDTTPTRLPSVRNPASPNLSLATDNLLLSTEWTVHTELGSDHLPIVITLQTTDSPPPISISSSSKFTNFKKAKWDHFALDIEEQLKSTPLPEEACSGEKKLRKIFTDAAKKFVPAGRIKDIDQPLPPHIVDLTKRKDSLRSTNPTSPQLPLLNEQILSETRKHKTEKWQTYVSNLDHKSDPKKLWKTVKSIEGKNPAPIPKNCKISVNGRTYSNNIEISRQLNKQYTSAGGGRKKGR